MKTNRSSALPWTSFRLLVAALFPLVFASALSAQESGGRPGPFRSWPHGELLWQRSRVAGRGASLFGASFGFGLTPRISLGGSGFQLSGSVPLGPPSSGRGALAFGYGGIVVEQILPLGTRWTLGGTLLIGAGHATVRSLGLETGSDNFALTEPRIAAIWSAIGPLGLTAGAGYRFTFGVQDLDGVDASDLDAPVLTLGIRLTGH